MQAAEADKPSLNISQTPRLLWRLSTLKSKSLIMNALIRNDVFQTTLVTTYAIGNLCIESENLLETSGRETKEQRHLYFVLVQVEWI